MTKAEIRRQIKATVKDKLTGNWGYAILIALPGIIFGWVSNRSDYNSTINDVAQGYGFTFPTVAVANTTIFGILAFFASTAAMYAFLNFYRTDKREPQPFLQTINAYGESKGLFLGTLVVGLLQFVLTFLWLLLLFVPGIIKSFSYSQALFAYKDAKANGEDIRFIDAITRSRELMDGHKWELFVLYLSFLGWGIVVFFTFGIGTLWLTPYMNMTLAGFYDHLKKEAEKKASEDVTSEV
ncbi:DUF975 family protein [Fructobacillus sp. M2-14]|uniref:DUF975 family protein n=1 Tax=Fructobacillus broussonetiae TaxID=2713173 RepID=A0ABS5R298_9LACO|nr:DUF975 family protein [Fructobacillus broussonetiae]MBS9338776.1 DUF975 family protein [Fructobacillus broussonetiae]